MKVLVIAAEPIDAGALRLALGEAAGDAEVLVVAPALDDSPLRYWLSDADAAIARAEQVQEETVERLEEEGVDAAGDTGESDPLIAARDALATFDADRILVAHRPRGRRAYREDRLLTRLEELGRPVERLAIDR